MSSLGSSNNGNDAPLCANNCGFYGNPKNRNLCSVCYAAFPNETGEDSRRRECSNDVVRSKDLGKELIESGEDSRRRESSNDVVCSKNLGIESIEIRDEEPNLGTRRSPSTSESYETAESAADLNTPAPKTKNRCKICTKKVGLLGFNCRCGGSFCGKHRHPEEHSCDVDHKEIGRKILAKQIVECKADKLEFRV